MSDDHIHEEAPIQPEPPRGPFIVYEATYMDRKGRSVFIEDIRGMQFDRGFYFLYVQIEEMPVPEIVVLDLSSQDVRNLKITPVDLIEPNA